MCDLTGRLAPVTGARRGGLAMGRGTAVRDGGAIFAASVLSLASAYVHGAPILVTGGRLGR